MTHVTFLQDYLQLGPVQMVVVWAEDGACFGGGKVELDKLVRVVDQDADAITLFEPLFEQTIGEPVYSLVQRAVIEPHARTDDRRLRRKLVGVSYKHLSYGHKRS
jgi:hypothetical protein